MDVLTITANGEPTLFPYLKDVVHTTNVFARGYGAKSLILSNGSSIYKKEIQEILSALDIVKLSLDCVSDRCFKKLDRFHDSVDIKEIIDGMVEFRQMYKGELVIETLFVKGLNDSQEEIELLKKALKLISPDRYDIGSIDRPPAFDVEPVSEERLEEIALQFDDVRVFVAKRKKSQGVARVSWSKKEIVDTLKRRPLTTEDARELLDDKTLIKLDGLIVDGIVAIKNVAGVRFLIAS